MIKMRPFNSEKDYLLMQRLIRENYLNSEVKLYPSPADLDYWRYIYDNSPNDVMNAKLWVDEKEHLIAFAWMNDEALDFVCHYRHKDLLSPIIDWSENARLTNSNDTVVNCLYVFDCDTYSESICRSKGYTKSKYFNYYGKRDLLEEIPRTQLPIGFIIKNIETEEEIKQRAFMNDIAGNEITSEKYKVFMNNAKNYRQDMDLIALTTNGEVVGYCTVQYDSVCNIGIFEPYAVRKEFLRKGIGKNLLLEGLRRLKTLGCTEVYANHSGLDSDEIDPALALNEAVGFKLVGKNYLWYKKF